MGRLPQQRTLKASSVIYIFCPWAHMSGPSPFVHAPFSYKRGGMRRYTHTHNLRLASSYKPSSNISHNGVGYYAPAARTTLNPCVFLCSSRIHLAGKTFRPIIILRFRAGAFRHTAGEFPLRQTSSCFSFSLMCLPVVFFYSYYLDSCAIA